MAKIKLTKTAVEAAQPQAKDVELRDTVVPGFLCKIAPAGRKVFMLQYRTNSGQPRKPSLGLYGELTVEQARVMAQDWLAEVPPGRRSRRRQGRGAQGAHDGGAVQEVQPGRSVGLPPGRHESVPSRSDVPVSGMIWRSK